MTITDNATATDFQTIERFLTGRGSLLLKIADPLETVATSFTTCREPLSVHLPYFIAILKIRSLGPYVSREDQIKAVLEYATQLRRQNGQA